MKGVYKLIIAAALIAALAGYSLYILSERKATGRAKEDYFAVVAELNDRLRQALADYYNIHNQYPERLSDLSLNPAPDTPESEMLKMFSYTPGGRYYIISWDVQWEDEEPVSHKEHAVKGKVIFFEDYVNDRLIKRTEHPNGLETPTTR